MSNIEHIRCPLCGHTAPASLQIKRMRPGEHVGKPWVYVREFGGRGHCVTIDRQYGNQKGLLWIDKLFGRIVDFVEYLQIDGIIERFRVVESRFHSRVFEPLYDNWSPSAPEEIGYKCFSDPVNTGIEDVNFSSIYETSFNNQKICDIEEAGWEVSDGQNKET